MCVCVCVCVGAYLKDLCKLCVSVGEHGVDAVDGVLGLARRSLLGLMLQYRQQDPRGRMERAEAITLTVSHTQQDPRSTLTLTHSAGP